jgi:hypothetical protein
MRSVLCLLRRGGAFGCAALVVLVILSACRREDAPLPPLPADQIAAEFGKGFNNAKQNVKDAADRVLKALAAKDYPAAYQAVQELCSAGNATKEQQRLAARAMITIAGLLQTAQVQGDEKAAAALKSYQSTK